MPGVGAGDTAFYGVIKSMQPDFSGFALALHFDRSIDTEIANQNRKKCP